MEQQQTNNPPQDDNQQHVATLEKLLDQIDQLNIVNDDSKTRLSEALKAAVEALQGNEKAPEKQPNGGGLDLSADPIADHLMRVAEGRPSREDQRHGEAVRTLVELTQNTSHTDDHDDAAKYLARLVKD
jgi:TolA-binding protein